jgi:hypothetical protein
MIQIFKQGIHYLKFVQYRDYTTNNEKVLIVHPIKTHNEVRKILSYERAKVTEEANLTVTC